MQKPKVKSEHQGWLETMYIPLGRILLTIRNSHLSNHYRRMSSRAPQTPAPGAALLKKQPPSGKTNASSTPFLGSFMQQCDLVTRICMPYYT